MKIKVIELEANSEDLKSVKTLSDAFDEIISNMRLSARYWGEREEAEE